jgi:hypothetical protein
MQLFRRMWLWSQCNAYYLQRQQRRRIQIVDQSNTWTGCNSSSSWDIINYRNTTKGRGQRNQYQQRQQPQQRPRIITQSILCSAWWRLILFASLVVIYAHGFTNIFETTTLLLAHSSHREALLHPAWICTNDKCGILMFMNDNVNDDDEEVLNIKNDDLIKDEFDDDDDDDFLGEELDTAGIVLDDLLWRVEKLRLEEQNTKRFLKSKPRFLPYEECCKWVQALNRWKTEDDWNEWISMGEKRNAYIPVRTLFYFFSIENFVVYSACNIESIIPHWMLAILLHLYYSNTNRVVQMNITDGSGNG